MTRSIERTRRTRRAVAVAIGGLVALSACGTRLSPSAFRTAPSPSTTATATATAPGLDVGVTADTITIGTIDSKTNFFDPRAFTGPYYGLRAFVDATNRAGGINGRRLVLKTCDDAGSATQNVTCVRRLIETDHVFALVSNAILTYAGAPIVNRAAVPDVGSEPIDNAYTQYEHLWDVYGEGYPRDGRVGFNGLLRGGTEVYAYFKAAFPKVPLRAAIVSFNQQSSKKYAASLATGLRRIGYRILPIEVNFALPDWNSAAIAMKHFRAQYVFDAIDRQSNERLCLAMDDNRFYVTAKVTTTQSWTASIGTDFTESPRCRNSLYATGDTLNYEDVQYPPVAAFRAAMAAGRWNTTDYLSEWALEGWAGAQWFADAATSCGAALTRRCVEAYLGRATPYTGHGLLTPRNFVVEKPTATTTYNCLNVVRWQDNANGGAGGWVTQVRDVQTNCFTTPVILYRP
jgi:branched-chain amino acid transport system substrate-binding protein